MVLQVYLDPCTINCRKVLAGLDLMNVPFEIKHVDYFKGEQKSPEYLKVNPHATVPSAVDGGGPTITESNAILMYAADKYYGSGAAYPSDLAHRAEVNRWLLWEASQWFPSCYVYLVENVVKPLLGAQPDAAAIDAEAEHFHTLAKLLDAQLDKTKWLAGDEATIADIAVAAPMHLHAASKLPLEPYANLRRWITEQVEMLPSWKKTQDAVDAALLPAPAAANGTGPVAGRDDAVTASLNYTKNLEPAKLTELYFYESPATADIHEPGDAPSEVAIHNGWPRVEEFSVDQHGFSLRSFTTSFTDWEDDDATRAKFYPDVADFLKTEFRARRVFVFDHTIRTKANDAKKLTQETNTSQRAPVMLVHCDYTSESGPLRVKQLLPDDADDLLSRRVAFINVWKPIHNVVEERPLAMCDVTTSKQEDYFKLHLRYRDRDGENYVLQPNPEHKWYYFPKITPEQVILLKTFDSETDGRARFVGHSAFEDPTTRSDAPVRESVEIRTMVFF